MVVTSIKPLELIVYEIAGDAVATQSLLPSSASPHQYQLRPSERSLLEQADLFIWIGPDLERFLVKPISLLPADRVITAQQLPMVTQSIAATGIESDGSSKEHSGNADHDHDVHHHNADPHIWLDPQLALNIAIAITERLQVIDPPNADNYRANLAGFKQRISVLDRDIQTALEPLRDRGYLVLHDGYGYFEARYGVSHQAAMAISPDRAPGPRHLAHTQSLLAGGSVECVFREPQYHPAWLDRLLATSDAETVRINELDPLGAQVPLVEGYTGFMRGFVQSFTRCLRGEK